MFSPSSGSSSSGLCSKCNSFIQGGYRESKHHGTLFNLKTSGEARPPQSCNLCRLLWTSVQSEHTSSLLKASLGDLSASKYVLSLTRNTNGQPHDLRIKRVSGGGGGQSDVGVLSVVPQDGTGVSAAFRGLSVQAGSTGSWSVWTSSSIASVREWLHECNAQHPWCGRIEPKKVPTRIIDISNASSYKLIETTPNRKELYVALSYVWGDRINDQSVHQTKLTTKTRDDFKKGIKPSSLTTSHREGCAVARELGYKYIWIDALCILQGSDNLDDWKAAAVEVPHIYGNAAITIIAGRGYDSRQGFLETLRPLRLPYQGSGGTRASPSSIEFSLVKSRTIGATNERAWCFQESLLSRRNLIFGTGQLIYQCRKHKKFQDGKHDYFMFDEPAFEQDWVLPIPPDAPLLPNDKVPRTQNYVLGGWYRVAHMYAMRGMFDPFDCYAALAGIARRCETALTTTSKNGVTPRYLAGIWETESFAHGLMWRRYLDGQFLQKPGTSNNPVIRAPSWSWMALVGRILFHCAPVIATGPPTSTFHRAPCCFPKGGSGHPWASGKWGIKTHLETKEIQKSLPFQIQVRGRPHRVRTTPGIVREYMMIHKYRDFESPHGSIDDIERPHMRTNGVVLQDLKNPHEEKGVALGLFDCEPARYAELWALPVLTIGIGRDNVPSEGLLLSKNAKGVFHRVGIFWIRESTPFMAAEEQVVCIE